jgi:hypothetical protein
MITKFKIFEKKKLDIKITNLPENIQDRILDDFTIIAWKGKKKNGNKNYKIVRPIILDGYYNDSKINIETSENNFLIKLTMSNNDYIEAKYEVSTMQGAVTDNNISIQINHKMIYDLGDENNTEDKFLSRIRDIYIKFLEKRKWKIKD